MKRNYTKYRVVYDKSNYLCSNRRLSPDIDKARVFSCAEDALRFASFDIKFGNAEIFKYVPGCVRCLVSLDQL